MKKNNNFKQYLYIGLTLFAAMGLTVLLYFVLDWIPTISATIATVFAIIRPLIYGAAIAYLLYPVCVFFEKIFVKVFGRIKKHKLKRKLIRGFAIFFSMVFGIGVVAFLIYMILPDIVKSIEKILYNSPSYIKTIQKFIDSQLSSNEGVKDYVNSIINGYTKDITSLLDNWGQELGNIVSSVGNSVLNITIILKDFFIGLIVAIYLLADRSNFKNACKRFIELIFNKKHAISVKNEIRFANGVILNFISGRILDSAIIGICCYILMIILDIPFALLVSVLVGVTNIIPFFGPFIGAIPSGLLILIESPLKCLVFVIMIIVLQQIDGNIIGPKIVGNQIGLSSFWVLFSMLVFGGLFGLTGMIIGVPLFAIVYDIISKLIKKAERKKNEREKIKEKE
ncbi:MAG: AI-2E family transporter [Clostridia bacterium]|nr:AI-2E family transporter [Clostridia bacterium]